MEYLVCYRCHQNIKVMKYFHRYYLPINIYDEVEWFHLFQKQLNFYLAALSFFPEDYANLLQG